MSRRLCLVSSLAFASALAACGKSSPSPTGSTGNSTGSGTTAGSTTGSGSTTSGAGTGGTGGTSGAGSTTGNSNTVTYTGPETRFIGRIETASNGNVLAWSGTSVATRFTGTQLTATLSNDAANQANKMAFVIDGNLTTSFYLTDSPAPYTAKVTSGTHSALLVKLTEAGTGTVLFGGFTTDGTLMPTQTPSGRFIEFIGDSITAGYGDLAPSPTVCDESPPDGWSADPNYESAYADYSALTAVALNADWTQVAWSGKGVYENRNVSDTVTMPQLYPLINPLDTSSTYNFAQQADVVVINLGTNDFYAMSQGNTAAIDANQQAPFTAAYTNLIQTVRAKYPKAYIIVALGPMLSQFYPAVQNQLQLAETWLQAMVKTLRATDPKVSYIEFPANASEYGCDDHPNAAYQLTMSQQLTTAIQQLTSW